MPNYLPKGLYHFAFLPAMNQCPGCSTPVLAFNAVGARDSIHSNKYMVISNHCFNLHFPGNILFGTSSHMLTCHLHVNKVFSLFLIGLYVFLLLSFKSSCIIWGTVLGQVCLLQINYPSLCLVFSFF